MSGEIEQLKKYKIGVLSGGSSSEREISLKSGKAVFDVLQKNDFDVLFMDIHERSIASDLERAGVNLAFIALHGKFGEDGSIQRILDQKTIPYTGSGPE